jgi:hypothetical protein
VDQVVARLCARRGLPVLSLWHGRTLAAQRQAA